MWDQYQNGRSGNPSWTGIAGDHKPSWMTETGSGNPAYIHYDGNGNPDGAFSIALQMNDALAHGDVSAYLFWQMSNEDSNGQATGDELVSGTNIAGSKKYPVVKQFARFIRPGDVRLGTSFTDQDGLKISAYEDDKDRGVTMVLINTNPDPRHLDLDLSSLLAKYPLTDLEVYRTDETDSFAQLPDLLISNNSASIDLPAFSIVTLTGDLGAVPEPGGALLLVALAGGRWLKRRRR